MNFLRSHLIEGLVLVCLVAMCLVIGRFTVLMPAYAESQGRDILRAAEFLSAMDAKFLQEVGRPAVSVQELQSRGYMPSRMDSPLDVPGGLFMTKVPQFAAWTEGTLGSKRVFELKGVSARMCAFLDAAQVGEGLSSLTCVKGAADQQNRLAFSRLG